MKNYAKIIGKEWNTPVNKAQVKIGEHAPVEVNNSPTLIHRDASVRMFKLLQEELWEFKAAYDLDSKEVSERERLVLVTDAIFDMQYVLSGMIAQHGLEEFQDIVMDEIHRSNLTKLQGGNIEMNDMGKILKPSTYSPPKLIDLI